MGHIKNGPRVLYDTVIEMDVEIERAAHVDTDADMDIDLIAHPAVLGWAGRPHTSM